MHHIEIHMINPQDIRDKDPHRYKPLVPHVYRNSRPVEITEQDARREKSFYYVHTNNPAFAGWEPRITVKNGSLYLDANHRTFSDPRDSAGTYPNRFNVVEALRDLTVQQAILGGLSYPRAVAFMDAVDRLTTELDVPPVERLIGLRPHSYSVRTSLMQRSLRETAFRESMRRKGFASEHRPAQVISLSDAALNMLPKPQVN